MPHVVNANTGHTSPVWLSIYSGHKIMRKARFWPWQELQQGLPTERFHGLFLGRAKPNAHVAAALGVPKETLFSLGLEVGCVPFRKKGFFELAADQAAEIVAACSWAGTMSLVIQTWTRDSKASPGIPRWRLKNPDSFALCPAKLCHNVTCFRFARKDGGRVSLLR